MADYMKLSDDTVIKIDEGASLDKIIHHAFSKEEGESVVLKITSENTKHVEFFSNLENPDDALIKEPSGIFDNMIPDEVYFDEEKMLVFISLRKAF